MTTICSSERFSGVKKFRRFCVAFYYTQITVPCKKSLTFAGDLPLPIVKKARHLSRSRKITLLPPRDSCGSGRTASCERLSCWLLRSMSFDAP